jgi:hypothetical protein
MTPAQLLADPEGTEVMITILEERAREARRRALAERLHAGERGVA